jgi:hypothetical protein
MLTKILSDLESEIASLRWKRKVLKTLFDEGKISPETFNIIDRSILEIETAADHLREIVSNNIRFWEKTTTEEMKVLEGLLVEFRFLNLVGEMDDKKWRDINIILNLGINSLKEHFNKSAKNSAGLENALLSIRRQGSQRLSRGNRAIKERDERTFNSLEDNKQLDESHCMNPWKPNCRRTDIKLSIYYNGRFLPICRKCWSEISEKNIEWTIQESTY